MKIYKVKVNGKEYEVILEEVNEVKSEDKVTTKVEDKVTSSTSKSVNAPIGGKVLDVKVSVGDKVNKGDLVCVIEAMKMENEVLSPCSGIVKKINISKGAQVANKEEIIVIE